MTKQLENGTINEMKGLLSLRPNTIGIIIHGGNKSKQIESMTETANSDIFVCHIEELHMIRNQIEAKKNPKRKGTIRMEYPSNELNNRRRQHLNWKEKRRERVLRWKALRTGLTKEERIELEDLNFVEVITKGKSIQ
ncbi:hypothetical protein Glove_236g97 [Diversispora epigaea]|uniref:Uncharacterized protein n=1 Tax=Diversispora epigaea TaxID=1348612 RepID=A0A397IGH1_9GLOM|nr:hypothetical protein Glove_236g97 [Diversispora epigaea]